MRCCCFFFSTEKLTNLLFPIHRDVLFKQFGQTRTKKNRVEKNLISVEGCGFVCTPLPFHLRNARNSIPQLPKPLAFAILQFGDLKWTEGSWMEPNVIVQGFANCASSPLLALWWNPVRLYSFSDRGSARFHIHYDYLAAVELRYYPPFLFY